MFLKPKDRATNSSPGALKTFSGAPVCTSRPRFMKTSLSRHREGLLPIVCDVDGGHADLFEDRAKLPLKGVPEGPVQRPQGLVQHQQPRRGSQSPCQRHPLLLSAGELVDLSSAVAIHADQGQQLVDSLADRVVGQALHPEPEGHIAEDVHMGEQGQVLEHQPESPLLRRHASYGTPVKRDGPTVRLLEPRDKPQHCRLAAPTGPQKADHLAHFDREGDSVDSRHAVE